MADESESGDGASVSLTADTSPFEKALDKAAEKAKGWSAKVTAALETVNAFSAGKVEQWGEKVSGFADMQSPDIGAGVGTGIGAAVGVWFGGPAGAALGAKIGNTLGEQVGRNFDLTPLAKAADEGLKGFADATKGVSDAWGSVQLDAQDAFDEIKKAAGSITYRDLFQAIFEGNEDASAKIVGVWDKITSQISDFVDMALYRASAAIDSVWAKIQEPIAKVADVFQAVLVKVGLLEEGTASWGAAVRNVQNVGETVIGALAYGFGFLEGLLKKIGGYVIEYVALPWAKAMKEIYASLGSGAGQIAAGLPEGAAKDLAEAWSQGAKSLADEIDRSLGKIEAKAKELQNIGLLDSANAARANAVDRLGRGRQLAEQADADREVDRILDEIMNKVEEAVTPTPAMASTATVVQAFVEGSREASNTIARANAAAGNMGMSDRLIAATDEANEKLDTIQVFISDIKDNISSIAEELKDAPLVREIRT